eukprot:TRINITY_DN130_c0_g1_i18.p1 TRINITY_DN130_c0_g1~~TRINITY_DN130_c0_g1_i18.p1  ORF type:complete len:1426 (+),score=309.65 TRINITY_DN130_c0_g1_i18:43-4320(+)
MPPPPGSDEWEPYFGAVPDEAAEIILDKDLSYAEAYAQLRQKGWTVSFLQMQTSRRTGKVAVGARKGHLMWQARMGLREKPAPGMQEWKQRRPYVGDVCPEQEELMLDRSKTWSDVFEECDRRGWFLSYSQLDKSRTSGRVVFGLQRAFDAWSLRQGGSTPPVPAAPPRSSTHSSSASPSPTPRRRAAAAPAPQPADEEGDDEALPEVLLSEGWSSEAAGDDSDDAGYEVEGVPAARAYEFILMLNAELARRGVDATAPLPGEPADVSLLRRMPEVVLPLRNVRTVARAMDARRDGSGEPVRKAPRTEAGHLHRGAFRGTYMEGTTLEDDYWTQPFDASTSMSDEEASLADTYSDRSLGTEADAAMERWRKAAATWCAVHGLSFEDAVSQGLWRRQNALLADWWQTLPGAPLPYNEMALLCPTEADGRAAVLALLTNDKASPPAMGATDDDAGRGLDVLAAHWRHTEAEAQRVQSNVAWDRAVLGVLGNALSPGQVRVVQYEFLAQLAAGAPWGEAKAQCNPFVLARPSPTVAGVLGLDMTLGADGEPEFYVCRYARSTTDFNINHTGWIERELNMFVHYAAACVADADGGDKFEAWAGPMVTWKGAYEAPFRPISFLLYDTMQGLIDNVPALEGLSVLHCAAQMSPRHDNLCYKRRAEFWELLCFRTEGGLWCDTHGGEAFGSRIGIKTFAQAHEEWLAFDRERAARAPTFLGATAAVTPLDQALSLAVTGPAAAPATWEGFGGTWSYVDYRRLSCPCLPCRGASGSWEGGCEFGMTRRRGLRCPYCKTTLTGRRTTFTLQVVAEDEAPGFETRLKLPPGSSKRYVAVSGMHLPWARVSDLTFSGYINADASQTLWLGGGVEGDAPDAAGREAVMEVHWRLMSGNVLLFRYQGLGYTPSGGDEWEGWAQHAATRVGAPSSASGGLERVPLWSDFSLSIKEQRFRLLDEYRCLTVAAKDWEPWPMLNPPVPSHERMAEQGRAFETPFPVPVVSQWWEEHVAKRERYESHVNVQRVLRMDPAVWAQQLIDTYYEDIANDRMRRMAWSTGDLFEGHQLRDLSLQCPRHPFCKCVRDEVIRWSCQMDGAPRGDPCFVTERTVQSWLWGPVQAERSVAGLVAVANHSWRTEWLPEDPQMFERFGDDLVMEILKGIHDASMTTSYVGLDCINAAAATALAAAAACAALRPVRSHKKPVKPRRNARGSSSARRGGPRSPSALDDAQCTYYYGTTRAAILADPATRRLFLSPGDTAELTKDGHRRLLYRRLHDGYVGQAVYPDIHDLTTAYTELKASSGEAVYDDTLLPKGTLVTVEAVPGRKQGAVAVVVTQLPTRASSQGFSDTGQSDIKLSPRVAACWCHCRMHPPGVSDSPGGRAPGRVAGRLRRGHVRRCRCPLLFLPHLEFQVEESQILLSARVQPLLCSVRQPVE